MVKLAIPKLHMQKSKKSFVILAATILITGAAVYLLVSHYENKTTNVNKNPNGSTANLSGNNLNNAVKLAQDNVTLTAKALDESMDGSADAQAAKQKAYDSATQLGNAINKLYGDAAEKQFNQYWKVYMDQSFKYAVAEKANNQLDMDSATNAINFDFALPLSTYISKINPAVSTTMLRSALQIGAQYQQSMIDAHIKGDAQNEESNLKSNLQFTQVAFSTMTVGMKKATSNVNPNTPNNPQSNKPSSQTGKPTTQDLDKLQSN